LDRGQVEFLVPVQQFAFVMNQGHHLPSGQVDAEESLRLTGEFVHSLDYKRPDRFLGNLPGLLITEN